MRERNRRIVLASGAGLVQRIAQLLTALITLPLALHVLGVVGFGIWAAATSLAWLSGMLDLGLGNALITLVPQAISSKRIGEAQTHVLAALLGSCGVAVIILGLGGLLFWLQVATAPFAIAIICLAINVPLSIARNIWFGLQKGYIAAFFDFTQTALTLGLLIIAAFCDGSVITMTAAVYGGMVIANATSLALLLFSQDEIRPKHWRVSLKSLRTVITPGCLFFVLSIVGLGSYAFDNVLALIWLGPTASAQIGVAMRLCTTAIGFLGVMSQPLWPAFVEAAAMDDRAWEWRTLRNGTVAVVILASIGSAMIVLFGQSALRLWLHADFYISPLLLWAMSGWIMAMAFPSVIGLLLNAVSILRFRIVVAIATTAFSFGFKYLAFRKLGVAGIMLGTPVAGVLIAWPSLSFRAWRWISRPNRHLQTGSDQSFSGNSKAFQTTKEKAW